MGTLETVVDSYSNEIAHQSTSTKFSSAEMLFAMHDLRSSPSDESTLLVGSDHRLSMIFHPHAFIAVCD